MVRRHWKILQKTRNNAGEFAPPHLKNILYVPTATCSLISVLALRADGHQTIYPEPESGGVCRAGIYNCRKGLKSPDQAIALVLSGNMSYVQIFHEHQLSRSDRQENVWIEWSKRLVHASISTFRAMARICDGSDDLKLAPIPRHFVGSESSESPVNKLAILDILKHDTRRAAQPVEVIHMDLKGCTPFLLGHMVYVDDHSHFSCLSFIQSNSEVFDHVKRFLADTALFRSTFTWCCLRCDNADDNTCVMMRTWPVGNGDGIETSSAHERHDEPWQNREVEAHIGHASNMNRIVRS